MHATQPQIPFAAAPARRASRLPTIIRLVIGMTALCLIGATLAAFVLRDDTARTPARKVYPPDLVGDVLAYDLRDPATTTYGSFTADAVQLVESGDVAQVDVSLSVDNRQDGPIDVPTLDELRLVNMDGAEATYLGGGWRDSIVRAHSSSSGEFRFAAPRVGGMLILEYRERNAEPPIRVAVGYALERSDASAVEPASAR
jgi:hypothetical protein